jgi:hypothetical protein
MEIAMTAAQYNPEHIKDAPPSYSGYNNGCRCEGCRESNRAYQRTAQKRWRQKNPERRKAIERRHAELHRAERRASVSRYNKSPYGKARIKKYRKQFVARVREMLDGIKLERGCADCGYRAAAEAMDFDHVKGIKRLTLSTMAIRVVNMKAILEELEKCEVVCANCHRIRTKARRIGKWKSQFVAG